jgi:hypothetical protein
MKGVKTHAKKILMEKNKTITPREKNPLEQSELPRVVSQRTPDLVQTIIEVTNKGERNQPLLRQSNNPNHR